MNLLLFVALSGLAASVGALPASIPYSVHERRGLSSSASQWQRRDVKLDRRTTIPMKIALTQRNLDQGHDFLMDVSGPSSANYGKHWSSKQVAEMFSASDETITAIKTWLAADGIVEERITLSRGRNWISFEATVEEAESLLKTEYKVYESTDSESSKSSLACDEYSLPLHVRDHVDFITPTVQFDAALSRRSSKAASAIQPGALPAEPVSKVSPTEPEKESSEVNPDISAGGAEPNDIAFDLSACDMDITPQCLRALYNMPNGTLAGSSFGIVEYAPQSFIPNDLDLYLYNLNPWIPYHSQPIVDFIDGSVLQTGPGDFYTESNLDLQLATSLTYPQQVTVYQVGDINESGSFNTFLDAVDATYCSTDGGDNPNFDPQYPDTSSGGYDGHDCGTLQPASVISTSYGANEAVFTESYLIRQCNEYMKLGLQGVTILYSTGDFGVAGNGGACCVNEGCADGKFNDGSSGTFNPSAAPSCPYVTAVGATQVNSGASVSDPESAASFSAGGFSNVFPLPQYQASAVSSYLSSNPPPYSAQQFNNSGNARAYPDISANGVNTLIVQNGSYVHTGGTSASAPIVASLFTLINTQLIAAGKSPVGFVNPVLYANPDAMNDIVSGSNPGCGTEGFSAVEGWDPVTGLGTPDYNKLLDVFMNLGGSQGY